MSLAISDHHVEVEDGTLFARRFRPGGTRPEDATIVLFHDSLGSVELWRDFPEKLVHATGLPVVAYDRLGFGRSSPHPRTLARGFREDEARTSVPALREALAFDRFVAFGHSVGGAMAVATAAAFPDACAAVVSESAQAFVEDRTTAGIREAKIQFADPAQLARLVRYHGDKARWVLDAWIESWLDPAWADWTLDASLAEVRCPLLALHGDRDEYGSDAHPDRIATRAAGPATKVLLADAGHVPHRERPERVLDEVTRFLVGAAVTKAT